MLICKHFCLCEEFSRNCFETNVSSDWTVPTAFQIPFRSSRNSAERTVLSVAVPEKARNCSVGLSNMSVLVVKNRSKLTISGVLFRSVPVL